MDDKIIINHPHLGLIEAEYKTVLVTVNGGAEETTSYRTRLLFPPTVGGKPIDEFAIDYRLHLSEAAQDPENCQAFADTLLLAWLHEALPSPDHKRGRMFDPRSFDRLESLVELTRATDTRNCPAHQRILAAAGELNESASDLLQLAIYERPCIEHPLTDTEFSAFRRMFLDEVRDVAFELTNIAQNAIADARKKVLRQNKGDSRARRKALGIIDEVIRGGRPEPFVRAIRKAASLVFTQARRMEVQRSRAFDDLVRQTTDLLNAVGRLATEQGLFALAQRGEDVRPQFAALLTEFPGQGALDALVDRFLERFMDRFDVVRPCVIGEDEIQSFGQVAFPPDVNNDVPEPEFSFEQQYVNALVLAKESECLIEKYRVLGEIRAQFVNRMESIRGIYREAEMTHTRILGDAFRVAYRTFRSHLTRAERRLYKLLYFPQPFLDGRIAFLDPVISSFVLNLDDDTQLLAYLTLVENADARAGTESLRSELARRWRAYLRFYPAWLDIVRGDEQEQGHRKRTRAARVTSLESIVTGDSGDPVALKTLLSDAKAQRPDAALNVPVLGDDLLRFATKYCSKPQAKYLEAYFDEGKTEAAIAAKAGVSQQAVSKGIRSGLRHLKEGLLRDAVFTPDDAT